jgi:ATP-dependent Clp protease ATP-binding subunit ClpB
MTSNIGAPYLLEGIDSNGEIKADAEKMVIDDLKAHFRPEFLNRLDETILFKPLTKDNLSGIIDLIISDINKRLDEKRIHVRLTDSAKTFIADEAYDPVYGARPLKRYVQKHVETMAARLILSDMVSEGDTIQIDVRGGELVADALKQVV